jgi:hypothetical protein
MTESLSPASPTPWTAGRVAFWARTACDVTFLLNVAAVLRPMLLIDDFQIVVGSWTWHDALANLWLPQNEHAMPLGRLSTWALARLAGPQTNLPLALALQGPLALLGAVVLLYLFVRRETGQPFVALLAMTLFGVNTHYQNAVYWFAASFAVLALDTLLLGVLAAQRWRQTGRRRWLLLSAGWCALAPGWFGSGILAGPLCSLYLLSYRPKPSWRAWGAALVPLLGTLASLAVILSQSGRRILTLPRVEVEAVAWQTFNPLVGLGYTLRAMVDDVVPGALGFTEVTSPVWVAAAVWGVFVVAGIWWWRHAPARPLLVLGLGLIGTGYLLSFTARAYFPYETVHHWSRYQLFAHLGLVLFVCGGLPRGLLDRVNAARPRVIDMSAAGLFGVLLLTQCPRISCIAYDPTQAADLRRVERVDARCREHHIDAATARRALPEFEVFGMFGREVNGRPLSGWDLLRGSDDPQPMSVEEARRLLGV